MGEERLVSASGPEVSVWGLNPPRLVSRIYTATSVATSLDVSPDGRYAVLREGGDYQLAVVYDLRRPRAEVVLRPGGMIRGARFSGARRVVTDGADLLQWDLAWLEAK